MALEFVSLSVLKNIMKDIENPSLLCFGYPDLLITDDELRQIFGLSIKCHKLKVRSDSEKIINWHGRSHDLNKIYDTYSLFEQLECELFISDIAEIRGGEIILDLNLPLTHDSKYNIVYDGGTLEHCFNIGQAIQNMASLVKVNGHIVHINPMNMINHGFYNLNPTFYSDFYRQNGHEIISMRALVKGRLSNELDPLLRLENIQEAATIVCVAQKKHDEDFIYPTQAKYLLSPTLG